MKNLPLIILIALAGFVTCNVVTKEPIETKKHIVSNVIVANDSAKEMRGISIFKVGDTYDSILKKLKDEIRKDNKSPEPKYYGYMEPYLDIIEESFNGVFKITYHDTIENLIGRRYSLEDVAFDHPYFKTISMREYYIGDVKISNLRLSFFRDTLYNVKFDPEYDIIGLIKKKYGRGLEYISDGTNDYRHNITWENETMIAKYEKSYSVTRRKEKVEVNYSIKYFEVELKDSVMYDEISKCRDISGSIYGRVKSKQRDEMFNKL